MLMPLRRAGLWGWGRRGDLGSQGQPRACAVLWGGDEATASRTRERCDVQGPVGVTTRGERGATGSWEDGVGPRSAGPLGWARLTWSAGCPGLRSSEPVLGCRVGLHGDGERRTTGRYRGPRYREAEGEQRWKF